MLSSEMKEMNRDVFNLIEDRLYDLALNNDRVEELWVKFVKGEAEVKRKERYKYKISFNEIYKLIEIG